MLGPMNNPIFNDVEIYAPKRSSAGLEDLDCIECGFTTRKLSATITYTQDGRRLIDGKLEKELPPPELWDNTLKSNQVHSSIETFSTVAEEDHAVESLAHAIRAQKLKESMTEIVHNAAVALPWDEAFKAKHDRRSVVTVNRVSQALKCNQVHTVQMVTRIANIDIGKEK